MKPLNAFERAGILEVTLKSIAEDFKQKIGRPEKLDELTEYATVLDLGEQISYMTDEPDLFSKYQGIEVHVPMATEWENYFEAEILPGQVQLESGLIVPESIAMEAKMKYKKYSRLFMRHEIYAQFYFDDD